MAYDVELAERVREALAGEPDVVEKRMFGGLAFLVRGHMAVCVGADGLLLRVDPERRAELLAQTAARPSVMGTREMKGWVDVDVDPGMSDADLSGWVEHGLDVVRGLPPK